MQAAEAARAKNTEQILETGEKIYDVCTACHRQYIVENGQSQ
jgi:cytochrome c2